MTPYHEIFPHARAPFMTLDVPRKTGQIPKGSYGFLDCYCTEPGCDCRQVAITVVNEKHRRKALIHFALDGEGPVAGPYLEPSCYQAPYASDLLELFVHSLNSRPEWLTRIQGRYREVRELVDRKRYRGRAFPKPGRIRYRSMPSPDLHAFLEESLKHSRGHMDAVRALTARGGRSAREAGKEGRAPGMAGLVELYAQAGPSAPVGILLALRDELRRHLLADPAAGEELASLLPVLCRQSPQDDEKIDAALRLLRDLLEFYQVEAEGGGAGARQRMQRFQKALALRVFAENEDVDLSLAVARILSGSRVRMIPDLAEAGSRIMADGGARSDLQEPTQEEFLSGIARSLRSLGVGSAFEGARELVELFADDPELQIPLAGALMTAEDPFLREVSALLLFDCDPDVSLKLSQLLASVDGSSISPETLRRLIISRNWFPEGVRKNVDRVISTARRARVECAPLPKAPAVTVYASPIDGSGAQGFQVTVPERRGYTVCSLLLKLPGGVVDAFTITLRSRRELDALVGKLRSGRSYLESSEEHLDLRVCHALADGAASGTAPSQWLVRIAEILGRDRWRGIAFDAAGELERMCAGIASGDPRLPGVPGHDASLEEPSLWHLAGAGFGSWFEEGESVGAEIEAARAGRKTIRGADAVERIMNLLETRRSVWLERLVVDLLWLREAKDPPPGWHGLLRVAQAVADPAVPLQEIPFMVSIARKTLEVYRQKCKSGNRQRGGKP